MSESEVVYLDVVAAINERIETLKSLERKVEQYGDHEFEDSAFNDGLQWGIDELQELRNSLTVHRQHGGRHVRQIALALGELVDES